MKSFHAMFVVLCLVLVSVANIPECRPPTHGWSMEHRRLLAAMERDGLGSCTCTANGISSDHNCEW
jgi:hypothetical protein